MISVTDIKVTSFDIDHLDIYWKIADTDESLDRYSIYMLRSIDGQEGPFTAIAGPFDNTFRFRDPDVNRLFRWRTYFYKLRVVHKQSGEEHFYGPAFLQASPDLIALEIQRRAFMTFQEFNGRKALLYPALTFGQRCPDCYDHNSSGNTIGRETQQNCKTCYDMQFVGGFATPILVYIQMDPSPTSNQLIDVAEKAEDMTSGRAGPFPQLNPKDMIIEGENVRWMVETCRSTQKNRATLHQEFNVRRIGEGDIRYAVPVVLDPMTQFSPAREFTRPMTLGNTNERYKP